MKGVLIVNMGGAASPHELKLFLARMFKDPSILPFGNFGRNVLSFIISNMRYKKSWKKYELIGKSPIIEATKKTVLSLQKKIGENYSVKMAFSYSTPLIKDSIDAFVSEGIDDITIIPLYPQASFTTTSSVERDVNEIITNKKEIKITFIKEFYFNHIFVNFWSNLIINHINYFSIEKPFFVFSAHSIPKYMVASGDTYPKAIENSAKAIAQNFRCNFEVAYQSGMKLGEWIGPDIKDCLSKLSAMKIDKIIIVPISFVNENLETLYDLDHDIIPFGKSKLGIKNLSRIKIPDADDRFIELLSNIIETYS